MHRYLLAIISMLTGCAASSSIVQPDYEKWKQIKPGMMEAQVDALIGKPLSRGDPDWWRKERGVPPTHSSYRAIYGRLRFNTPQFAGTDYEFVVSFGCEDHRVESVSDPFGGKLSLDGQPTVPNLIYPVDGQKFDHYPRYLDVRWQPSSGVYPIEYEVQFDFQPGDAPFAGPTTIDKASCVPYLLESWVGKNPGVWRVRAKNNLGVSEWSEPRRFSWNR